MLKSVFFILLFFMLKIIDGNVSNEIFSILPNDTNVFLSFSNRTNPASHKVFSNHKSLKSERVNNKSLLRIPSSKSNLSSLICFPRSDEEYQNVYILAQGTCRRMGFMTISSIKAKTYPLDYPRIKSTNIRCSGLQSDSSSCKSIQNPVENCRMVTEVFCGACNGTIKGFKGVIQSPGYPFASLADVTCEWNIIVPEYHNIILSFNQFDAMDAESANLPCGLHKPYIYIIYGIQSKVTIDRYCRLNEVKNFSIPFHSIKIILFTGLHSRQEERFSNEKLGIFLTYEATMPTEEIHGSPLKMLAFFILGVLVIACIIFCHYAQKYKLCDCYLKERDMPFLAHPMQQAYDLPNYNRRRTEEATNKYSEAKAEKVNVQRNSKMVFDSGKGINEYSNLLDPPARFIPSVERRDSDIEQLNIDLHKKLDFMHSYHGPENPNRLSVSSPKDYYDYPNFRNSRHASSDSHMEGEKTKLKSSMSSC